MRRQSGGSRLRQVGMPGKPAALHAALVCSGATVLQCAKRNGEAAPVRLASKSSPALFVIAPCIALLETGALGALAPRRVEAVAIRASAIESKKLCTAVTVPASKKKQIAKHKPVLLTVLWAAGVHGHHTRAVAAGSGGAVW